MKFKILYGIRARLIGWYVGTITIILLFFSLGVFLTLRHMLLLQIDLDLSKQINELRMDITEPSSESKEDLNDFMEKGSSRICRVEKSGITFLETPSWNEIGLNNKDYQGLTNKIWFTINGHHYHINRNDFQYQKDSYIIYIALDISPAVHYLRLLALVLAICLSISLSIVFGGGIFLTQRILKPIREITSAAAVITERNLNERLPVINPNDEFGELATVFNGLLSRLSQSFDELKRFTADASHELRTPLTAIRSAGEIALQSDLSAEGYREVLGSILEEVDRQRNLVENLLMLARSDTDKVHLRPERLCLGEEVDYTVELLRVLADEKRQEMFSSVSEKIFVLADQNTLRQAFINIIDNAIKFSPETGHIHISVSLKQKDLAIVEIIDQGPGISPEDQVKIFDRFYRIDKSRSQGNGGTGLGLSIAKWAVEINGGRIELESEQGRGSCFRLLFRPSNDITKPAEPEKFKYPNAN